MNKKLNRLIQYEILGAGISILPEECLRGRKHYCKINTFFASLLIVSEIQKYVFNKHYKYFKCIIVFLVDSSQQK